MNPRRTIHLIVIFCFVVSCSLTANIKAQDVQEMSTCNRPFDGSTNCRLSTSLVRKIAPGTYAVYYQLQGGRMFLASGLDPNCLGDKIKDMNPGRHDNASFGGHEFMSPGPTAPTDSQRFFVDVPDETVDARISVIVRYHDASNAPFFRDAEVGFTTSTSTTGMPFTVPSTDLTYQLAGCPAYAGPIPSGG